MNWLTLSDSGMMSNVATSIRIVNNVFTFAGNVILKSGKYTIICKQLIILHRKLREKVMRKLKPKFKMTMNFMPLFASFMFSTSSPELKLISIYAGIPLLIFRLFP